MKIIKIRNRGVGLGTANLTYVGVPIKGDGMVKSTVVINNDSEVETVTVSHGGNGYTYGTLDLVEVGIPAGSTASNLMSSSLPMVDMGATFTENLGSSGSVPRFENDIENPDFITGNEFARIGICENPIEQGTSTLLTKDKASAVYTEACWNWIQWPIFTDSFITQTVGVAFNCG